MIAKITRGHNVGGLLRYLLGPGQHNEHTAPHVMAAWDAAPELHQPPPRPGRVGFDVRGLTVELTDPALAAGLRLDTLSGQGPVWHCSLRTHPDDRRLSDREWEQVVTDLLDRTGIARRDDLSGCRWVAVRHAEDHVHVAATLLRQDTGRRVHPYRDYHRAAEACRDAEHRFGLTSSAPADRTAAPAASRAEREKAARRGRGEPTRDWLRRAARTAATQAHTPQTYFRALSDLGVWVRPRKGAGGELVGYAVADPRDLTPAAGGPVWFGGRRLAPDLTLPRLQARWAGCTPATTPIPPAPGEHSRVGRAERSAALTDALTAARRAAAALAGEADPDPDIGPARGPDVAPAPAPDAGAGVAHATADLLTATCLVTSRTPRPLPWAVADGFDRAARTAGLVQSRSWAPVARELRRAAWRLAAVRGLGRRGDETGTAELVVALAALVAEVAAYHQQHRRLAQAAAARRAHQVLVQHTSTLPTPVGLAGVAARRPPAPVRVPTPRRPPVVPPPVLPLSTPAAPPSRTGYRRR